MKTIINFLNVKLTEKQMLKLTGGGSGGTGSGSDSSTVTPNLPINLPGTSGIGMTVTVGGSQSPIGAMAVLAGTDMSFGSMDNGSLIGHETVHTSQNTGSGAYK